ncbi:MAG: sensor histidine kinase [Lachnospiraceae bacterium]
MQWIRRWYENAALYKKFLLNYIIFGVLPMTLMTVFNYYYTKDILMEKEKSRIAYELQIPAMKIEAEFCEFERLVECFADDDLYEAMLLHNPEEITENLKKNTKKLHKTNEYIKGLYLYEIATGKIYTPDGMDFCSEQQKAEWEMEKSVSVAYKTLIHEKEIEPCFLKRIYMTDPANDMIMKLSISSEVWQHNFCRDFIDAEQCITDQEDRIVAATNPDHILRSIYEVWQKEKMACYYGEIKPIGTIWVMLNKRPIREKLWRDTILIWIVFICFFTAAVSAVLWIYAVFFRKRTETIKLHLKQIKEGKLSIQIPYHEKDELGELSECINQATGQLQQEKQKVQQKELDCQRAEMELLQEQIQPHLLYNTLSMVTAMIKNQEQLRGADILQHLIEFYRGSLNNGKIVLTVREEIALTDHYLSIQNERFGGMIHISYNLEPDIYECHMLKLLLQPIVENAIRHGRAEEMEQLEIEISIFRQNEKLVFEIFDDGNGMKREQLSEVRRSLQTGEGGYGIYNVYRRIQNYYGDGYGIYIESEYGLGTKVTFEIPAE